MRVDGGSYVALPNGKYRGQVCRRGHTAPTVRKRWFATRSTVDGIKKWIYQTNRDLDNGLDPERSRVPEAATLTVGDWWDTWWPVRVAAGISPRYRQEMERRWRLHVHPRWGDVALDKVESGDVQKWVNILARTYGPVYVEDIYKTLATLMGAAVDRRPQLLQFTPCYKIRLPEKTTKSRVTTDEAGILHIAARCDYYAPFILTLAFTGVRPEEAAGLLRDRPTPDGPRVDTVNHVLRLPYADGALVEFPDGRMEQGPLKNRQSERTVLMPPFLAAILAASAPTAGDYWFAGPRGGVVRRSTFERRFWRPACDGRPPTRTRAAWAPVCPGLELRGLRHTHKKILQAAGVPDFAIEARLGHSRKGISGVYSHVAVDVEAAIARVLQERWEAAVRWWEPTGGVVRPWWLDVESGAAGARNGRVSETDSPFPLVRVHVKQIGA